MQGSFKTELRILGSHFRNNGRLREVVSISTAAFHRPCCCAARWRNGLRGGKIGKGSPAKGGGGVLGFSRPAVVWLEARE